MTEFLSNPSTTAWLGLLGFIASVGYLKMDGFGMDPWNIVRYVGIPFSIEPSGKDT